MSLTSYRAVPPRAIGFDRAVIPFNDRRIRGCQSVPVRRTCAAGIGGLGLDLVVGTSRQVEPGKGELLDVGLGPNVVPISKGPGGRWCGTANLSYLLQTKREPYLEDIALSSWKAVLARLVTP
jgi:hypothetical protein